MYDLSVLYFLKSFSVTSFTFLSVHCAESCTATINSQLFLYFSTIPAFGNSFFSFTEYCFQSFLFCSISIFDMQESTSKEPRQRKKSRFPKALMNRKQKYIP